MDGALLAALDKDAGSQVNNETYLEGREKRNRRRSVDRIEGREEPEKGRAGHCKKRPVECLSRTEERLAPHIQQSEIKQRRATGVFLRTDRRSCDGACG